MPTTAEPAGRVGARLGTRWRRCCRRPIAALASALDESGEASDAVYHYLERSSEIAPSEQRVGLAGLRDAVEIQGVSLGDSTGKPILSHLSLKLMPGSLVAMLGTDSVSTRP